MYNSQQSFDDNTQYAVTVLSAETLAHLDEIIAAILDAKPITDEAE